MLSDADLWVITIVMTIVTYSLRAFFILLSGRLTLPYFVRQLLTYAPPAVLFALIAPAVLIRQEQLHISLLNERLIAAVVAGCIAWYTRNILLTIVVGMGVLWLLQLWI